MKKATYYILYVLLIAVLTVEFVWSVVFAVVGAVGDKINELADALTVARDKTKTAGS